MSSSSQEAESESSGQALERYLAAQLASLNLAIPYDDVEYIARCIEEPSLGRPDKLEGIRGMLEGVVEGGSLPEEGLDEALDRVVDEWERLQALDLAESSPEPSPSPPPKPGDALATFTPEELETIRRQSLLRQYGCVEGSPEDDLASALDRPSKEGLPSEEKKAEEERRRRVMEAVRLDSRKKKHKKQREVDLMAPNLNRDKMAFKAQAEREAQKKASNERRDRNRLALEKQRSDAANAKADKQKKAAKQERRG